MASTDKLKIGLVLDDSLDKSDGVQQYVLTVGEWLRGQGHAVHYLVGETRRQDITGLHSLSRNVSVRFNGNRMSMPLPTARDQLQQLLAEEHFDVLHIQVPYSPFLAHRLILAAGSETAVVGTFHILSESPIVKASTYLLGQWTKRSLRRFDKMISVSSASQSFAQTNFGVESDVLPNVIDYQHFQSAKPLERYSDEELTILFLGRLVPRKGCQTLLAAVSLLRSQSSLSAYKVVICGEGPLKAELEAYSRKHNLTQTVEFAGFIPETDKPRYYASADIAVFPSKGGESFGIVLLEAMASGRAAVLAGDNLGYRTVLADHQELLFDPLSSTALAARLEEYITQNDARRRAQLWGGKRAAEFDIRIVGPKLVDIYNQALHKRHTLGDNT